MNVIDGFITALLIWRGEITIQQSSTGPVILFLSPPFRYEIFFEKKRWSTTDRLPSLMELLVFRFLLVLPFYLTLAMFCIVEFIQIFFFYFYFIFFEIEWLYSFCLQAVFCAALSVNLIHRQDWSWLTHFWLGVYAPWEHCANIAPLQFFFLRVLYFYVILMFVKRMGLTWPRELSIPVFSLEIFSCQTHLVKLRPFAQF